MPAESQYSRASMFTCPSARSSQHPRLTFACGCVIMTCPSARTARTRARISVRIRARIRVRIRARIRVRIRARIRARIRGQIRARISNELHAVNPTLACSLLACQYVTLELARKDLM
eukprot:619149-Rhodomonas_salina.1